MEQAPFDTRHGWRLYLYPAFRDTYDGLVAEVERLAAQDGEGYRSHPKTKILRRINDLILEEIPADPGSPAYRQGGTLGPRHKDWFRAKFFRRFRLFFRYDTRSRIIIYCWLNDEETLRKAGSSSDPYAVFARMLRAGNPPGDWEALARLVMAEKADSP